MKKFVCSVCGKEHEDLTSYMNCVNFCAGNLLKEQERIREEYLENMNAALNRVKSAEEYYKDQLRTFMNEYPDEYKKHFGSEKTSSEKDINNSNNKTDVPDVLNDFNWLDELNDIVFSSITDKDGSVKTNTMINGKDVDSDKALKKLKSNPETQHIAKLLDLIMN